MDRWQNNTAIVTGASAGIGAEIAEQLVKAGVKVVGLARRKERLDNMSKKFKEYKGQFYGIECDISKEDQILKTFKLVNDNFGPVHILINNAGIGRNTNLIEGDAKLWQEIINTNVLGLCIATREAVKSMKANQIDGHIVHINSISGHRVDYGPEINVYAASKHAVTALTETLRLELNSIKSKIKISSVSPGNVSTEIKKAAGIIDTEQYASMPKLEAKDVAYAVMYILSTPPHVQVHELIIKPLGEFY